MSSRCMSLSISRILHFVILSTTHAKPEHPTLQTDTIDVVADLERLLPRTAHTIYLHMLTHVPMLMRLYGPARYFAMMNIDR